MNEITEGNGGLESGEEQNVKTAVKAAVTCSVLFQIAEPMDSRSE